MNFVNEDTCQISYDVKACTPRDPGDKWISLDDNTLQKIFDATSESKGKARYVFVVEGLRQDDDVPYGSPW